MATRLDRVTSNASRLDEDLDLDCASLARTGATTVPGSPEVGQTLPIRRLSGAMAAWLALTFGVCHVALPALAISLGVDAGVLGSFWYAMPAFALASLTAVIAVVAAGPAIRLHLTSPRDPVIAATLGGLGVAAVVQNTSGLVVPYSSLGPWELAAGLWLNVLEMSLLGMMFASFTRRIDVALALGGGFQLLVLGLALTLMTLF